jgi:alpha-amylase
VKHIASWFFPRWIDAMERHAGRDLFVVGEYWQPDANALRAYVDRLEGRLSAFDVVLHYNFCAASRAGGHYDMRRIFDGALVNERPVRAVTFVDNHDSQPLQALESAVEPWFKPLAYGLILLRESGYPCVFLPDYDGAAYEDRRGDSRCRVQLCSHRAIIDRLLWARRHCAFGEQRDYFYHENVVGWTRCGDAAHPRAMAVLLSDGPEGDCWMDVRRSHTPFRDITGHCPFLVTTNADGWGDFHTRGGAISVWVEDNGSDDWPA